MLNGDFLAAQSASLARRLRREAGDDRRAQVSLALRLATSRVPSEAEIRRGLDLISGLESGGLASDESLKVYAMVVLNLNEFLYLD